MNTIKKFIHYYGPYKTVFFIDLICAAVISLIDLAYPQILRTMTKTLFTQDQSRILHALPVIAGGLFLMYVLQCLCKYYVTCQGHMMGPTAFLFLLQSEQFRSDDEQAGQ